MERSSNPSEVMLIDDVATALKITVKQIRRLERRGAFPIPRLPSGTGIPGMPVRW